LVEKEKEEPNAEPVSYGVVGASPYKDPL